MRPVVIHITRTHSYCFRCCRSTAGHVVRIQNNSLCFVNPIYEFYAIVKFAIAPRRRLLAHSTTPQLQALRASQSPLGNGRRCGCGNRRYWLSVAVSSVVKHKPFPSPSLSLSVYSSITLFLFLHRSLSVPPSPPVCSFIGLCLFLHRSLSAPPSVCLFLHRYPAMKEGQQ